MTVSAQDKERMARLVLLLSEAETDDEPPLEVRRRRIAAANEWRVAHGIPLLTDDEDPPELELFRRAGTLGLRQRRR